MEQPLTSKPSLFGMIWSPGEQFDRIRERPKIWGALIIVALLSTVIAVIAAYAIPDEQFRMQMGMPLSEDELAGFKMFGAIGAGIGGLIGTPVGILISAAIMLLVTVLAHTEANFKQLLSMNAYIYFVGVIGGLLNVLVSLLMGRDPTMLVTGLNSIIGADGMVGGILNGIEVFSIWTTILTAIGLHKVGQLSKGLSWTVAIVFFVVGVLLAAFSIWVGEFFNGMAGV